MSSFPPAASPCPAAVPWARLVDYWSGDLETAAAERLEEHLFTCAACTRRLADIHRLGRAVGAWARRGLRGGISPTLLERLRRQRLRVREYTLEAGGSVRCSAGPEDDLVVLRLGADLAGIEHVDVEFRYSHTGEIERTAEVPVIRGREVLFAERADLLRTLPAHEATVRLLAVADEGERVVARYTLHHSP